MKVNDANVGRCCHTAAACESKPHCEGLRYPADVCATAGVKQKRLVFLWGDLIKLVALIDRDDNLLLHYN